MRRQYLSNVRFDMETSFDALNVAKIRIRGVPLFRKINLDGRLSSCGVCWGGGSLFLYLYLPSLFVPLNYSTVKPLNSGHLPIADIHFENQFCESLLN